MTKSRKILFYLTAVIFAGLEVFSGVVGYLDRSSSFFKGLAPMLCDIILIPIVVGSLWGVFEATRAIESNDITTFQLNKAVFKNFMFAFLRAIGLLTVHAVISPIIYVFSLNSFEEYFSMAKIVLVFSLGVGVAAFLILFILSKLIMAAVREFKKIRKLKKERNITNKE